MTTGSPGIQTEAFRDNRSARNGCHGMCHAVHMLCYAMLCYATLCYVMLCCCLLACLVLLLSRHLLNCSRSIT